MVRIRLCKQVAVTCKQAMLAIARSTFTVLPPGDSHYTIYCNAGAFAIRRAGCFVKRYAKIFGVWCAESGKPTSLVLWGGVKV